MIANENFLIEELEQIHSFEEDLKSEIIRQSQILYEFNLYRCFCKFYHKKMCYYSSLLEFQNYCKKNNIVLI